MNKSLYFFAMATITNLANAECSSTTCANVYIDKLYANNSGIVYIGTSGDESLLNCAAGSGVYTKLNLSDPGASAIYSTLLSAQLANKKVQVRISEGSVGCSILYVTLERQ